MRRIATFLSFVLLSLAASAQQTNGQSSGYCYVGAVSALIQGLPSSNKLLGVIPSCTVTVYFTGTHNLAPLFDGSGTSIGNPFTATTLGYWNFYAANNAKYDVIGSGGNPPNIYPTPTVLIVSGGTGGGGSSGPPFSVQYAANNGGNFGSDPNITIDPINHLFKVAGAGTGKVGLCGLTSGSCFIQSADANTQPWTFVWPTTAPATGSGSNCLTALASGVGSWQPCLSTNFLPIAGGNLTGPVTGTSAVFQSLNGVLNAADQPGSDLGIQANNALAACSMQCTVYVPAGNYTYSTTITNPLISFSKTMLLFDQGAVMTFTGTGDAIQGAVSTSPTVSNFRIHGGQLYGTAAARSGVHLQPTNAASITGMLITGFSNGPGIWLEGPNGVTVFDNAVQGNQTGILMSPTYCNGATCGAGVSGSAFTPNQIFIGSNRITNNQQWGIQSIDPVTSMLSGALNDVIFSNDLELNGLGGSQYGAINVGRSHGLVIEGNYFEGSPRQIALGIPGGADGNQFRFFSSQGPQITNNYFTDTTATPFDIELLDTADAQISGNTTDTVSRNSSNCFINTLANNGTDIGETGTVYGKNHVENFSTGGNTFCIAGAGVTALAGAGSFPIVNSNKQLFLVAPNYTITSSGTTETVTVSPVLVGSMCVVSPAVDGAQAAAVGSTFVVTGTNTGKLTHPSGVAGAHIAILCTPNAPN